jgi:putative Mg2+ transporter-C (MgtC) family protein
LSGIGFIGAGAIIKKDDIALGVTTAATMWFMTVVGICFGAGKLGLGTAATGVALFVLWLLKWFDKKMPRNLRANLTATGGGDSLDESKIRSALIHRHYKIVSICTTREADRDKLEFVVQWRGHEDDLSKSPPVLADIQSAGIENIRWQPSERV